jgi:hypothetical protein
LILTSSTLKSASLVLSKIGIRKAKWIASFDPSYNMYYYYEKYSKQSTWERPLAYEAPTEDSIMSSIIRIQKTYRGRLGRRKFKSLWRKVHHPPRLNEAVRKVLGDTREGAGNAGGEWVVAVDPGTQQQYYHNFVTGESTWEVPEECWARPWLTVLDGEWQPYYYLNIATGQSSWEKPSL